MRKILFGAVLGAVAMYLLDPERGAERRMVVTNLWSERKDTVLEAARTTAGAVSSASQGVAGVVGVGTGSASGDGDGSTNGTP
ncbi:MAG: hypothetical protein M3O87_03575 [Candidatus Dormibacteraeota bacterium]|nr:hypothetical protein [Candidatus Dormibacteraeota bacterium]